MTNTPGRVQKQLATPTAAALAGVAFAILFATVQILFRRNMPDGADKTVDWLAAQSGSIHTATVLMPFAGIAFLWFLAVVRDGFGRLEDRFFSTVFLAAGILFVAMMFAATAVAGGLIASDAEVVDRAAHVEVVEFGKAVFLALSQTYALKMGAVFTISLATIWLKTGLMPKWLAIVSYLAALTLIGLSETSLIAALAFPTWVALVSILLFQKARHIEQAAEASPAGQWGPVNG